MYDAQLSEEHARLMCDAISQLPTEWCLQAGQELLSLQQGRKGDSLHAASIGWAAMLLIRFVESGHFDELLADVLQERTEAAGRMWGVDDTGLYSFGVQPDENE